jgi:hypothetical protein
VTHQRILIPDPPQSTDALLEYNTEPSYAGTKCTMSFAYYPSNGSSSSRTGISRTDDFQSSSVVSAAAIHKAIRDGEYAQLPDLVTKAELLWEANSNTGWTAMHYAASHFLPIEWWEWILVRAVTVDGASEKFRTCLAALGQSVVSVFLQSYFDPLPWQSIQIQNRSRGVKQGIEKVCGSTALQKAVQAWILHSRTTVSGATDFFHRPVTTAPSQAVHRVVSFWTALDLLARAAVHESLLYRDGLSILSFLAQAGSCPTQVADLVLVLDPNAAAERSPIKGSLPLHIWAATSHSYSHAIDGLLEPLLRANPEAAAVRDNDGRWPLHTALASGKSWDRVRPLFEIYPDALHAVDCSTELPAVLTAATVDQNQESVEIRARQQSTSAWNVMSMARKKEALLSAAEELNTERLTTIYQVLRAFPQVLHMHMEQS